MKKNEDRGSFRNQHEKRSPKNYYFGSGSDGYLYDFVKRAAKNDYFGHGSDGYMYDFVK